MFASVSRCVASFGAGRCPCPRRRISSRFRADFRGFLRLCGGQEQGSRRSPAKRVRWEEETQRNERVFAAFGRNEGYGACADEKQDKNFKTGARAPVFLRDRLSGMVQIRTVGGSVPPLQYPSPHSILQSRLKCGIIAHGKDVRIILLKKIYCRMFQACFGLGARVLPWRRPECITGAGSLQRLPELLADAGCKKPMIVASRRQCAAPEFTAMAEKLPAWSGFHGVTANPKIETVEQIVAQFRAEGCDSMVAIGGGSPMDAAKAAAARLARPNRSVGQLKGLLKVRRKIVPFAAVPTTAGTGSETTIAAMVTDETHHKYAANDLCLIPRWAILDPTLMVSLPAGVTAETGLDALTHAVEAYIGRFYNTRETRSLARQAVAAIFQYLPTACADGAEAEANPVYPVPVIFSKEDFIRVARWVMP